jgi:tRNA pseudouridine38-40 synthase
MQRYFIEVAYKGTAYKGFQIQEKASTIQEEVEKAFRVKFKEAIHLTGASRTDSGVHALQNYFHFDSGLIIETFDLYNLNALLPADIVLKNIFKVSSNCHSRFSAASREYRYFVYQYKDPFLKDTGYYYPFKIELELLQQSAEALLTIKNFASFSKRNTQVKNYYCDLTVSEWKRENDCFIYNVKSNRFLRGMVRGLVGTMLQVGRQTISFSKFLSIIENKDCSGADFSAPARGLFLCSVNYPSGIITPV